MGEPYVRDERLVLDLCGSSHCDPDGVVGRPFVNPIGQMTEVGKKRPMRMLRDCIQWKMSSSHIWTLRETLLRVKRNCGIADMRSARIVWTAAPSILCENSAES